MFLKGTLAGALKEHYFVLHQTLDTFVIFVVETLFSCPYVFVYRYHLKDVIVGKIYFLLVRIKIKHMEIQIIKRESTGTGIHCPYLTVYEFLLFLSEGF